MENNKVLGEIKGFDVNDRTLLRNCTLEENEVLKENIYKVYHGTNQKFSKFNFKNATQGIVWFTDSPESIEKGEHGGAVGIVGATFGIGVATL